MSTKNKDTSMDPKCLAERAARRRKERALRGAANRSHCSERGRLLEWFAHQTTNALREFKVAITQARKKRKLLGVARARSVRMKNLAAKSSQNKAN